MLSYLHSFHAGNFADVHKHILLTRVLTYLGEKDAPYCYFETHAGRGLYDLSSAEAKKTGEARTGIQKLADCSGDAPHLVRDYLRHVESLNEQAAIRFYPGSPALAQMLCRSRDRLILMERHPTEVALLKARFRNARHIAVHERDGYEGLFAMVPPPEKRGAVLIDPSYEIKQEYRDVVEQLCRSYEKWPTGTYIVWYPLLPEALHGRMLHRIKRSGIRKILQCELWVRSVGERGMYGSGLIVVNPPWRLADQMNDIQPWLAEKLGAAGEGKSLLMWLASE